MIIVLGKIEFHPEDFESVKGLAAKLMRETVKEKGCLHYAFAADLVESNCLQLSECWTDEEALRSHLQTPHIQAYREALKPLRVVSRVVRKYDAGEGCDL